MLVLCSATFSKMRDVLYRISLFMLSYAGSGLEMGPSPNQDAPQNLQ
jgi:hypothetical protein